MKKKILIMTALPLELNAVRSFLADTKPKVNPTTSSIYVTGIYRNGNYEHDVLLVETGAGNARSADETGRAIAHFKPDYVFFVGVAGGIKDVKLGDVVASTKVIGYEMGKDDIVFKPRFDSIPSSYLLEQLAKHIKRENKWIDKIKNNTVTIPEAYIQPIAAGEKVVASNRSTVFTYLKQFCSDAVAVDMEGNGFLIASRPYHVHAIEVRGISDLIENKEEADASGSQPIAATNAATFTFSMIDELPKTVPITSRLTSLDFRKELVNKLVELYPQGPEQDDIWKRAGGDVSIIVNSSSRKSQWFNLIEKLALGGGGKAISIESLINEVKADYPNVIDLLMQ